LKTTAPAIATARPRPRTPLAQALLPALIASIGGTAQAQSSVSVSGALDLGVGYIKTDSKSIKQMSNGSIAASSLVIQGKEDLGGGYEAAFLLRSLFVPSNGGISGSKFWGSEAKLGIGTPYGRIEAGRMFDPTHQVLVFKSPSQSNFAGAFNLGIGGYAPYWDNSIRYSSPTMGGLRFEIQHSLSILNDEPVSPSRNGISSAVALHYRAGGLDLSGVVEQTQTDNLPAVSFKAVRKIVMGVYDFGPVAAHFGYFDEKHTGIGVTPEFGLSILGLSGKPTAQWKLSAELGRKTFRLSAGSVDFVGLGAFYSLSKRTQVYSEVTLIRNSGIAQQAVYRGLAVARGEDTSGYMLGIRHNF